MLVPDSSQVLVSLTENADVSRNQHRIRQLGKGVKLFCVRKEPVQQS